MKWQQVIDPFGNIGLSACVAVLPVLFIFYALIIRKMKGYQAALIALLISLLVAIVAYGMPVSLALRSAMHGGLYGLFPVCWIVITAVYLFNIAVQSGQLEIIKGFMASVTPDRRLQALLIAFSFGAFVEGLAGFGAPVAITAAMLVGLGFNPLYAAGICLIANTAPVAFGSIGIPITVASQVSGIPEMAISQMVGRTLPVLSLVLPMYLVVLICGFKKSIEVLPAIMVCGISFAFLQWFSSNYLSPMLPDVLAGIGSIVCLIVLLKFWKPKSVWKFDHEPHQTTDLGINYSGWQVFRAFSPFIILTLMVIAWGLQPVKDVLALYGHAQYEIPVLHHAIVLGNGSLLPQVFKLNYLSSAGTAIFAAALISLPLIGVGVRAAVTTFFATLHQLRFPIITVAAILAFAYVLNNSGISATMAGVLANTGYLFPFFAPVLGWLGVFITGSDTSANALFGKLQFETALSIGVDPVVAVGANVSGGVVGKMISPQSIAIAAAAGHLVGKEGELFRFTVKHSFILLILICMLSFLQAYVLTTLIPHYVMSDGRTGVAPANLAAGYNYLLLLLGAIVTVALLVIVGSRKGEQPATET
ncbi:L-lactate permease [Segetibacter sp. 3557_3]|uniref:L-lactate permease n=1 Tax=Segetibacter sp. 3557_3 TaxID=2547429 RepID=UPI001058ED4E|nr:lactate permease LctP family transporter [Segetibacter sp. 3557_3]TDH21675.1 L-lactate permease [Segetibacter sp. 3557_3]